jgi:nitrogen fixation protein NifU and related proteins
MDNKVKPAKFKGDVIITFGEVPLAIRAEKALKAAGFESRLVAPPPQFRLGCALGLEIDSSQREAITRLLKEKGIEISRMVSLERESVASFYNETVIDHFRNPRNVGAIEKADAVGHVDNPSFSIDAELYLKIKNGIVTEARSKSFGCGATIASGSIVTEMVKGKGLEEISRITAEDIDRALGGLPASKSHCAKLGAELIAAALADYSEKERGKQV